MWLFITITITMVLACTKTTDNPAPSKTPPPRTDTTDRSPGRIEDTTDDTKDASGVRKYVAIQKISLHHPFGMYFVF